MCPTTESSKLRFPKILEILKSMTDNKSVVLQTQSSKVNEEDKKKGKLPGWVVPVGIGVIVFAVTAFAIYQVKKKRRKELHDLRYGSSYFEDPEQNKWASFFDFGSRTYNTIKKYASTIFGSKSEAPTMSASDANTSTYGVVYDSNELDEM